MKPNFFGVRDWWSQWSIDRAGIESGCHKVQEVREMVDRGQIDPHHWLRHFWTRRYALVGEVLYANDLASDEEYAAWFPNPPASAFRQTSGA